MKRTDYITAIIIILALHLLFVNTEIIIKLLKAISGSSHLSILQTSGAVIFALSYSLITVLIIKVYPNPLVFSLTALFDGFAVYLNYFIPSFFHIGASLYLGVYTSLIIIATGLLERKENQKNELQAKIEQETKQKQKLIQELQDKRKRLQLAYNRTQNPDKKEQTKKKLLEIDNQLTLLTNKLTTN